MLKRTSGDFLKTKSSSDGFVFFVHIHERAIRSVVRQNFVNYLRLIVDTGLVYLG